MTELPSWIKGIIDQVSDQALKDAFDAFIAAVTAYTDNEMDRAVDIICESRDQEAIAVLGMAVCGALILNRSLLTNEPVEMLMEQFVAEVRQELIAGGWKVE